MEEITEDSIVYTQQKESTPNSCEGCTFYKEEGCTATRKFYSRCTPCKTIWIKKETEVTKDNSESIVEEAKELYVDKDGVLYEATPCETRDCDGCAFYRYGVGEDCGLSQGTVNCVSADIIWVKKEVEVNTEPVKDSIKDESVTKPGVKHDQEKERYDLVPVLALEEVAKVLTAGAMKYNEDYEEENWRKVPNATRRYFSAAQRHLAQVRKGQTHDQETKLHHYAHAITNLMFLLEKELEITKD